MTFIIQAKYTWDKHLERTGNYMPYERSRAIEERFNKTLSLIRKKRLNARQLSLELGVSRPTTHRIITELKRRGYPIRSVHEENAWSYELNSTPNTSNLKQ